MLKNIANDSTTWASTIDMGPSAWPAQRCQFRISGLPVDDRVLIIRKIEVDLS